MAGHIAGCADCQRELAHVIQLRQQFVSDVDSTPSPSDRVWGAIASGLDTQYKARIHVGSFLIGLNVGIASQNRRSPVQGSLTLLGHKVRIIGKRKKGA